MTMPRLERLTLTKFRGSRRSTTLEFDPDKRITLVYGENGSGKSSIADAIDFVCNNRFGSLGDRIGANPRKHIVSYNATAQDLEVMLQCSGSRWRASLQGQKPSTSPPRPPRAFVLRRADIASVMESQPAVRYKALQAYITVPNVERSEQELRDVYKETRKNADQIAVAYDQALNGLQQYWQGEGAYGDNAETWARQHIEEDLSRLTEGLERAQEIRDRLDRLIDLDMQLREAEQAVAAAEEALAAAESALQAAMSTFPDRLDLLLDLLDGAEHYLTDKVPGPQVCPVCGKAEARDVMLAHIRAELGNLTLIRDLVAKREEDKSNLGRANGARAAVTPLFIRQCQDLADGLVYVSRTLAHNIDATPLKQVVDSPQALVAAGVTLQQLLANRSPLVQTIDDASRRVHRRSAIVSYLDTIDDIQDEAQAAEAVAARLKVILDVVERERKSYVADLTNNIAHEVDRLYTRIHPNEPLGKPTFSVKQHTAGSLELKAGFAGESELPPGAYYSEAHLDTLGLCVYLALARHAGVGSSLVVLDDVLTTVDEAHLDRIIDLLSEEAAHYGHLLIMTHSRTYFDRMRMALGTDADLIELHGWDLASGIRHSRRRNLQ